MYLESIGSLVHICRGNFWVECFYKAYAVFRLRTAITEEVTMP